jgi:magnesium transporter
VNTLPASGAGSLPNARASATTHPMGRYDPPEGPGAYSRQPRCASLMVRGTTARHAPCWRKKIAPVKRVDITEIWYNLAQAHHQHQRRPGSTGLSMVKRRIHRKRASVGAPPGTLVADPGSAPTTISIFGYDAKDLVEQHAANVVELGTAVRSHEITWINVNGLGDIPLIEAVGKLFGLHRLALEDVVNVHQRPKVEEFDDHLFIVTRMLPNPMASETEQVSMFLGKGYVLTFQEKPGDVFEPIRQRLRRHKGQIRDLGADYLAYTLLDAVIDGYFPALERRGEDIEHLEDLVVTRPQQNLVSIIHETKRDLLELRRAVWPQREMLNALIRQEDTFINGKTKIYLRDCYDHTIQLIDIIETYREICSGLVEIYLSSLSNRMNEIMKVLTIMATIFIPLSFIAGFYGMNFDPKASTWNMPELGWKFGYPYAIGLMVVVAAGLLFSFWRRGWIGTSNSTDQ